MKLYDEQGGRRKDARLGLRFGPGQGWFGGVTRS